MANKTGKFLAFVALATAAAAGGVALYKKYKEANELDSADFDLDEDLDEDFSDISSEGGRDYVTIPLDNAQEEPSATSEADVSQTTATPKEESEDNANDNA